VKARWELKPLSECARFVDYRGKTPPKTESGIRLITAKNVKMGFVQREPEEFVDAAIYDDWMTRGIPQKGDVLFTTEAPLGNVAQLDIDDKVVIGQRLITLQTKYDEVDSCYLKYALLSPSVQSEIYVRATGATVLGIKARLLKEVPVPLPRIEEQRRIVAVLDKAFEGLARARENTEANLASARELFDLTRDTLTTSDDWPTTTVGEIASAFEYGTSAKSSADGDVPVLRMGNVQEGEIDWASLKFSSDQKEIHKYRLVEGDVLFNRTNSQEHVGKTAIYRGDREAIFAGYLIRVGYDREVVDGDFLNFYLNSSRARDHGKSVMGKSVNQANISASKLKNYPMPLPPLGEQKRISQVLLTLRQKTFEAAESYKVKLADLDDLRQSLLQKAFAGELT